MTDAQSKTIAPAGLHSLLSAGQCAELLDVRTPAEYSSAHVPGARLIPLDRLNVEAFLKEHQPGRPLYVLCQSGGRARKAIDQLHRAGCADCVLVEGGTQAWIDAGLPVNRGASRVLPLIQQVQLVIGIVSAAGAALALAVNSWFALLPLFTGCGLLFAGLTGMCPLALLVARMPWNQSQGASPASCSKYVSE